MLCSFANNTHTTGTADNFTVLANFLDRSADFHKRNLVFKRLDQ